MREAVLLRAQLFDVPASPFATPGALRAIADGAVLVDGDRIAASGEYAGVRAAAPAAPVVDLRPAVLLPGFVDTHVHYPQVRVLGGLGMRLLDWLEAHALPEEARLADPAHARAVAREFLAGLVRNGTTAALVFGAHFESAQEILFAEADRLGLTIASGLVLSDRNLRPELHRPPAAAHAASVALLRRWHRRGRLRYAITPRFAVSASEAMLDVAGALLREAPDLLVQTHLNETPDEVAAVRRLFPGAPDYLTVYERHGLAGPRAVFAHNVHPTDGELERLASCGASVAHCPSSNAFLGSGLFPFRRHRVRGVRVALGSDVGGGTGFGLLREGLMAHCCQMLRPDGEPLGAGHLLYLATRAGAEALGLAGEVGDLLAGKRADLVVVRPPAGGTLATVLAHAASAEAALGAVITLAGEADIGEVYVGGRRAVPPG
ncbi:MAG: guanine deaminase [Candidatus Rokuibacteriota bacterium]